MRGKCEETKVNLKVKSQKYSCKSNTSHGLPVTKMITANLSYLRIVFSKKSYNSLQTV